MCVDWHPSDSPAEKEELLALSSVFGEGLECSWRGEEDSELMGGADELNRWRPTANEKPVEVEPSMSKYTSG